MSAAPSRPAKTDWRTILTSMPCTALNTGTRHSSRYAPSMRRNLLTNSVSTMMRFVGLMVSALPSPPRISRWNSPLATWQQPPLTWLVANNGCTLFSLSIGKVTSGASTLGKKWATTVRISSSRCWNTWKKINNQQLHFTTIKEKPCITLRCKAFYFILIGQDEQMLLS